MTCPKMFIFINIYTGCFGRNAILKGMREDTFRSKKMF